MIGYKALRVADKNVIATLQIPPDAKTNVMRNNVRSYLHAKFRCDKALVLKIEDENGKEYNYAFTAFFLKNILEYKKNNIVHTDFDENIEHVCAPGIHFFLIKEVAQSYFTYYIQPNDGLFTSWYDNGQISVRYNLNNKNIDGMVEYWYENGVRESLFIMRNKKIIGEYTEWYENGNISVEAFYKDGELDGKYIEYYDNKNKSIECNYKRGNLHGEYKEWFYDGNIGLEAKYFKGELVDKYKIYDFNGKLLKEINYN